MNIQKTAKCEQSRWYAERWCLEHWSLSGWSVYMHSDLLVSIPRRPGVIEGRKKNNFKKTYYVVIVASHRKEQSWAPTIEKVCDRLYDEQQLPNKKKYKLYWDTTVCIACLYTVKKRFTSFPSPAAMSLPNSPRAGIMTSELNYSCPGGVWLVTSRLETGNSWTFFYVVGLLKDEEGNTSHESAIRCLQPDFIGH